MTWPNHLVSMHCDDDDGASPSGYDVNLVEAKQLLLDNKILRQTDFINKTNYLVINRSIFFCCCDI